MKDTAEEIGASVDIRKAGEVESLDYDFVIIGSPIYFERPLKSVTNFMEKYCEVLKNKQLAVFVVCIAQLFGHLTDGYVNTKYIGALTGKLGEKEIETAVFKGAIGKLSEETKEAASRWIKKIIE